MNVDVRHHLVGSFSVVLHESEPIGLHGRNDGFRDLGRDSEEPSDVSFIHVPYCLSVIFGADKRVAP